MELVTDRPLTSLVADPRRQVSVRPTGLLQPVIRSEHLQAFDISTRENPGRQVQSVEASKPGFGRYPLRQLTHFRTEFPDLAVFPKTCHSLLGVDERALCSFPELPDSKKGPRRLDQRQARRDEEFCGRQLLFNVGRQSTF